MNGMEALGAVSSIIAIGDAGLKLYNYIESVASADKRLKTVATNLKITCDIVKHVGTIFEKEETAKLVGNGAIETAKVATKECQGVFDELRLAISKSERNRYLFPLREAKLELLAVQLEKLKSSLVLLMSVLNQATSLYHRKSREEREKVLGLLEENREATVKYDELKRSYDLLLSKVAPNPISAPLQFLFNRFSADATTAPPPYDEHSGSGTRALDASFVEPSMITKETLEKCSKQVSELLFSIQLITRAMGDDGAATLAHKNAHAQYEEVKVILDALFLDTTQMSNGQPSMVSVFPVTMADQARFDAGRRGGGEGEERREIWSARVAGVTVVSYEAVPVYPVPMTNPSGFEGKRQTERRRQGNGSASLHLLQPQPILPQPDEDSALTTQSRKGKKGKKNLHFTTETSPENIPLPADDDNDDDDVLVEPQSASEKDSTHDVEDEWAIPSKKSKKDKKKRTQSLSWEEAKHDDGEEKLSAVLQGIGATAAALSWHQSGNPARSTASAASSALKTAAVSHNSYTDGGWESAPTSDSDDGLTYGYGYDSDNDRKTRRMGFARSSGISETSGIDRGDEVDDLLHQWTTLYDDKRVEVKSEDETRLPFPSWFF